MKKISRPKVKYKKEELDFIKGVFLTAFNMFDSTGKKVRNYEELKTGVEYLKEEGYDSSLVGNFSLGLRSSSQSFIKKVGKAMIYSTLCPMIEEALEDMYEQIGTREEYDTYTEYLEAKKDYFGEYVEGLEEEYYCISKSVKEGRFKTVCELIDSLAYSIMEKSSPCYIWDSIPNNINYRINLIVGEA